MTRLVLNADDLGLTPAHATAVAALRASGCVTDVSLLSPGEGFDLSVRALREAGILSAGVHLCLVGGERPLSPPRTVPSVAPGGTFPTAWPAVAARVGAGLVRLAEVEREWEAQVAAVHDSGLAVTHLDSHQHLHLLPRLLPVAIRLARRFDIPFVRAPRADDPASRAVPGPSSGSAKARLLGLLGASARRLLARAGLPEPPRVLGLAEAGGMTPERWLRLLAGLPREGTFEVVLHPGSGDPSTRARYPWGYAWREEAEALAGEELRSALVAAGAVPVSFADLSERRASPTPARRGATIS